MSDETAPATDETAPATDQKAPRTKNTTPITLLMSPDGKVFEFIYVSIDEETTDEDGNVTVTSKTEPLTFDNAAHAWKWVGEFGTSTFFYAAVRNYGTKRVAPVNRLRLV